MRLSLFAAAAMAPLCLVATAASAASISTEQAAAVATATANGGAPDNVSITTTGAIKTTSGPALVLNSNNTIENAGNIEINNVSNSTVVVIEGGRTGAFTNSGTIANIEDFTPTDSNSDGVFEAPLASGSGRKAVQITGAGAFTGTISNSGSIFAEGHDSVGLSVETTLNGSISQTGTIGVTGDRAFGLRTAAPVNGDVLISGPVSTSGQASTAVSIGADVSGALRFYSSASSNAYSTAARTNVENQLRLIQGTPSELQQAGSAVVIGASLGRGLFLGAPPPGTVSGSTADADGDGVTDVNEGTGSISGFGSAPALLIGGANRDITLGAFGTGVNAYGVISRGNIVGSGLYDGISATGLQVGGTGGAVNITGGMRLFGAVGASAYEADATGLRLGAGANVPTVIIENGIGATISRSSLTAGARATASAILVQPGARLPSLVNLGTLAASATGPLASASTVVDQSGTLTSVVNQGAINATVAGSTASEKATGRAIALDLRANTAGVTLNQSVNPSPLVLTGTVDTNGALVALQTSPAKPSISGDILLGNGPNTVNLAGGSITGGLDFGSGASSFSITNGATYAGALSHTGPAFAINVASGALTQTSPTTLQAQSLTVGATGVLNMAVDPANNRASSFQVSGPASFANGAKVTVNVLSNIGAPKTYTFVTSPNLSVAGDINSLIGQTPYATIASASVAAGALNVTVRQRTAAEAGLGANQGAALAAVYDAAPRDSGVQSALFGASDRAGFITLYNQLLPDHSGASYLLASQAARAVSRAASDRGVGGAWVQEVTVANRLEEGAGSLSSRGLGIGLAGGVESNSRVGVVGVTAAVYTGETRSNSLSGDSRLSTSTLTAGVNWRADVGGLRLDAYGAGGYVRSVSNRQFVVRDADGKATLTRAATGSTGGWSLSGRIGAAWRAQFGALFLQPEAHIDYFRLTENGYSETGGGDAMNLLFKRRTGQQASGVVALKAGFSFGSDLIWRPEFEIGYREVLSGDAGDTEAQFVASNIKFDLTPAALDKGGPFARVGVSASNEFVDVNVSAGAEERTHYTEGDVRARVRFMF